jgi:TATA-box binding protein (TBP) (component of TFIID and TFIIIB)
MPAQRVKLAFTGKNKGAYHPYRPLKESGQVNVPSYVKLDGIEKLKMEELGNVFYVGCFSERKNASITLPPHIGGTAVMKPSGNIMIVGCKNREDIDKAVMYIVARLRHLGFETGFKEARITCTVDSFSIGWPISFHKLIDIFPPSQVAYNPTAFPAVRIYHQAEDPRFTASVFQNGKVVINGSFTPKQTQTVREITKKWLVRARGP